MTVRAVRAEDYPTVLDLNEESVAVLSPLDLPRLRVLAEQAALFLVAEAAHEVTAFLLVLREGACYDSPNYAWFAERYAQFLYVDRIVVSKACHGKGAGGLLYSALFDYAEVHAIWPVACEFDIEPPNPRSERFHAHFGFSEVGRQRVAEGQKVVSLQLAGQRVTREVS